MKTSKERLRPAAGSGRVGKPEIIEDLTPVEVEQVDEAVRYINERTIQSGLELAKDVGEYVLKTFFDGDYAKFTNASRSKSTSFRALVAREDLILGSSMIYVFVRVSRQLRALPAEVASRLTMAQHRALLPLAEPESKETMARRALDEGWSAEVLGGEVRCYRIPRGVVSRCRLWSRGFGGWRRRWMRRSKMR